MKTDFRLKCEQIWPDNTSSRLARASGYGQRAAQKFMAGESKVPNDVLEFVDAQVALLSSSDPTDLLKKVIAAAITAGVNKEGIASRLSILYRDLLDRDIQ